MSTRASGDVPEEFLDGDAMVMRAVMVTGTVVWRDGSMTTTTNTTVPSNRSTRGMPRGRRPYWVSPFTAVTLELGWWSIGKRGDAVIDRWRRAGVSIGSCRDPIELVEEYRRTPALLEEAVPVLCRLAVFDQVANLCVAGSLRHRLSSDVEWLSRFRIDTRTAQGMVLSVLWEVMAKGRPTGTPVLLRGVHNALRRDLRQDRPALPPPGAVPVTEAAEPAGAESLGSLLAKAQEAGALSFSQVLLLAGVHLAGQSDAELAAQSGRSRAGIARARQRAERQLIDYVRGEDR